MQFLLDAVPLYSKYTKLAQHATDQDKDTLSQLQSIYEEFQEKFDDSYMQRRRHTKERTRPKQHSDTDCLDCGRTNCKVVCETGNLVCTQCGIEEPHVLDERKPFNENVTRRREIPYRYKPSSYLKERLQCIQGMQRSQPPPSMITRVRDHVISTNIPLSAVTPQIVRAALREIRQPRYYKHQWWLAHKLNPDYHLMKISEHLQDKILALFGGCYRRIHLQLKARKIRRRNFISYPLFLRCVFEHLGYPQAAKEFAAIKGKANNATQRDMLHALLREISR